MALTVSYLATDNSSYRILEKMAEFASNFDKILLFNTLTAVW